MEWQAYTRKRIDKCLSNNLQVIMGILGEVKEFIRPDLGFVRLK